jgi:hypothetical protein
MKKPKPQSASRGDKIEATARKSKAPIDRSHHELMVIHDEAMIHLARTGKVSALQMKRLWADVEAGHVEMFARTRGKRPKLEKQTASKRAQDLHGESLDAMGKGPLELTDLEEERIEEVRLDRECFFLWEFRLSHAQWKKMFPESKCQWYQVEDYAKD